MPSPALMAMAKNNGVSKDRAEYLWGKAKKIVKKQYPDVKKGSDKYFQIVMGIVKKMFGIKEEVDIRVQKLWEIRNG